jgi:hypothetical protein
LCNLGGGEKRIHFLGGLLAEPAPARRWTDRVIVVVWVKVPEAPGRPSNFGLPGVDFPVRTRGEDRFVRGNPRYLHKLTF